MHVHMSVMDGDEGIAISDDEERQKSEQMLTAALMQEKQAIAFARVSILLPRVICPAVHEGSLSSLGPAPRYFDSSGATSRLILSTSRFPWSHSPAVSQTTRIPLGGYSIFNCMQDVQPSS
jgi:hypothetical protein